MMTESVMTMISPMTSYGWVRFAGEALRPRRRYLARSWRQGHSS
jgi:hypothetical protein